MSGVHTSRQGFVTKSTIPAITRMRGTAPVTNNFNINAIGTPGTVFDSRVPRDEGPFSIGLANTASDNSRTAVSTFSPYRPDGYWSCEFGGASAALQVNDPIGSLNYTSNFTLEAWVYISATPNVGGAEVISKFINGGNGWYSLTITNTFTVTMRIWSASNVVETATSTATVPLNTWVHISGGRNGSNITVSVAGTYTTAPLTITPRSSNNTVVIGMNAGLGANALTGMISNVRMTYSALYSGNFTPSTTPVLSDASAQVLTCNSPSFFNRANSNLPITSSALSNISTSNPFSATESTVPESGSFSFDGSVDHFLVNNNAALDLTTGDWTCEGWFYSRVFKAGETYIFAKDSRNGTSNPQYGVIVNSNKKLVGVVGTGSNTTSRQDVVGLTTLQLNCWYHFAFVKSGTTLTLYLNGRQDAQATQTATMTNGNYELSVGSRVNQINGTVDFSGSIGDLRIVKSAVYTTPFTPSYQKLTAITDTRLLLVAAPTTYDVASSQHQLRAVQAYPAEVSPFGAAAPGSYIFPPISGASLSSGYSNRNLFDIGTQDFTMEAWVYVLSGFNGNDGIIFNLTSFLTLQITADGNGSKLAWRYVNTYRTTSVRRIDLLNKWTHVAVARQSGVLRFFVDGVLTNVGAGVNPSTFPDTSWADSASYVSTGTTIGQAVGGLVSYPRLTVGQALYTSTFAKPTVAPTVTANTRFLLTVPKFGLTDSTYLGNAKSLTALGTPATNAVLTNATAPSGLTESFEFNGGRYLNFSKPGDSRLNFAGGDFTVECFVRVTSTGAERAFVGTNPPVGTYFGWFFGMTSTGAMVLTRNSIAADATSSVLTWDANTWYHVAAVRYGNTVRFYRNGALVNVANITAGITFYASGGGVLIGARHNTSNTIISYFIGNIAAVSVINSPLYLDDTHTVPSLPLQSGCIGPNFVTNAIYGVNQLS